MSEEEQNRIVQAILEKRKATALNLLQVEGATPDPNPATFPVGEGADARPDQRLDVEPTTEPGGEILDENNIEIKSVELNESTSPTQETIQQPCQQQQKTEDASPTQTQIQRDGTAVGGQTVPIYICIGSHRL